MEADLNMVAASPTAAAPSRGVPRRTCSRSSACPHRTAPSSSARPPPARFTPSLPITSCRAASSSRARATSRWRVQRERQHCVECTFCSRSPSRQPICSSSAQSLTAASRFAVARPMPSRPRRRCTAPERLPAATLGSAPTTRRSAHLLSQQTSGGCTTILMRLACSTVPAIARWCKRGAVRSTRWRGCAHARRRRARRCTRPTSTTRCARVVPWGRAVGKVRRACRLQWTTRCSKALRASHGRCARCTAPSAIPRLLLAC